MTPVPGVVGAIHLHTHYSHGGRDSPAYLRSSMPHRSISFLPPTDHAQDLDAGDGGAWLGAHILRLT
jgi:hypothetical protein